MWFGRSPSDAERTEFANRRLALAVVTSGGDVPDFTYVCGAVFCGEPPGVPVTVSQLYIVRKALDYGSLVFIIAADDATQAHLGDEFVATTPAGPLRDSVLRRTGKVLPHECAEAIARHDAGPLPNASLEISLTGGALLCDQQRFLVQRAFNDCIAVTLSPLAGGRSASTFAVQAILRASEAGPRPLPFFVKLDSPAKIVAERQCYERFAENHIPWYLRPNLQAGRCVVGVEQGILVGSFVEQSESLWDAVLKGKGTRYVHALFEDTLMGWRRQGHRDPPSTGALASALSKVFQHTKISQTVLATAQQFGVTHSPKELWGALLNLPPQKWRRAPMHGDMHAENVRVRNNDAIIIDLANAEMGPMCADLASLDVWLAFQVPPEGHRSTRELWTKVVGSLYEPRGVNRLPAQEHSDAGLDWLLSSVRQIRMISMTVCESETEYATAVALYLLRRASYPSEGEDDEYRRAYAYWLGSMLVSSLSSRAQTAKEPV